jgi:hypothetical protein
MFMFRQIRHPRGDHRSLRGVEEGLGAPGRFHFLKDPIRQEWELPALVLYDDRCSYLLRPSPGPSRPGAGSLKINDQSKFVFGVDKKKIKNNL